MKKHWYYLKYVLTHKWHVFWACRKMKVSLWTALFHDWDKFLPQNWFSYVNCFYGTNVEGRYNRNLDFNYAWNSHQKINKHHWQYWCLLQDDGNIKTLPIPDEFIREMVADWIGVSNTLKNNRPLDWYLNNKQFMKIDRFSQFQLEKYLYSL